MIKSNGASHLRITLICGFILLILSGGFLVFFYLSNRSGAASGNTQEGFGILLREWDTAFSELFFTEREFDFLNGELDRLEKKAIAVDSWLSILKRRRMLADINPPSGVNYKRSIDNALNAFPASQPIAALACAAAIKSSAINAQTEQQLRKWLPLLTDSSYNALRIAVHVLLGDFKNPQTALAIPAGLYLDNNFAPVTLPQIPAAQAVNINLAVLKIINRDYSGAAADIQNLLYANTINNSAHVLRFAAEFYYDFGELLRSAEIFSYLSMLETNDVFISEDAMIRQADALYLAGYTEMAAAIWSILAENPEYPNETSLYNLSVTSLDQNTYLNYLEKLVNINIQKKYNRASYYGLIRYSRLFDNDSALGLLQNNGRFPPENYPYIALEICKRYAQGQILGRQLAQTWLLLEHHERNEDLYRWAAWHFNFHRQFDEMRILINRIDQLNITGSWVDVYKAVHEMIEGNLEKAENFLRLIPSRNIDWLIYANLGRILEAERLPARALEHYEIAAANVQNPKTAASIQQAIARCYTALSRPNEARRALIIASDFDPDNIAIRLELDRFF